MQVHYSLISNRASVTFRDFSSIKKKIREGDIFCWRRKSLSMVRGNDKVIKNI